MAYTINDEFYQEFLDRLYNVNTQIVFMQNNALTSPTGLLRYLYNPDNNFFNSSDLGKIFGTDTQSCIKSIRFYPVDFQSAYNLTDLHASGFYIGGKDVDYLTGEAIAFRTYIRSLGVDATYLLSFGDISIPYLDDVDSFTSYEPYTKMQLYLPFYGTYTMDAKRFRGKTLELYGSIDLTQGLMNYYILSGGEFVDSVQCDISIELPVYGNNFRDRYDKISRSIHGRLYDIIQKNPRAYEYKDGLLMFEETHHRIADGNTSPYQSMYNPLEPYVLIYNPILKYNLDDTNYNHAYGVPCKKIDILGEFGGFTKVDEVHIKEIAGATKTEIEEIEQLLHSGIILDNTNAVFTIYKDVRNASLSNQATTIQFGWTYQCDVTATSGYQLDSIQVFMGGQDVTSTAVSGNHIYLPNVSADIRIIVRASVIPVYHTITFTLTGATSSSQVTQVLTGESYSTYILPDYTNGYILGTYEPIITMGGIVQSTAYANGQVFIQNVQDDIVITGTLPQVSTMTDLWRRRANDLVFPDVPIDLTNVTTTFEDNSSFAKETEDCIIDNQTDLDGNFISFTDAFNNSYKIDIQGRIYENDAYVTTLTKILFYEANDNYTNYSGLLKWLDTIAYISLT